MPTSPSPLARRWFGRLRDGALAGLCVAVLGLAASAAPTPTAENPSPTWTPTGWSGGGYYFSAAFHPTRDGVLFLGMDVAGVAKSTDHGRSFRVVNTGLVDYGLYSLAVDWKNPDVVYAGTEGGLHKSTDGGETWRFIPGTGRKELRITSERTKSVRSVAPDPSDSSIVYAASPGGKIYKSTDGAMTWRAVHEPSSDGVATRALRVQFGKVNDAYFGGIWTPLQVPTGCPPGDIVGIGLTLQGDGSAPQDCFLTLRTAASGPVYRSRNLRELFAVTEKRDVTLGADDFVLDPDYLKKNPAKAAAAPAAPAWASVVRADFSCSGPLPASASVVYIGRVSFVARGASGAAVHHTARDFETDPRTQSYGNIRVGRTEAGPVYSVSVSTKNPARVLAASEQGLILSEDKGESWRAISEPVRALHATFDPSDADVIYGAFASDGVRKSTDKGATWTSLANGLPKKFSAREIVVSPADSHEVYLIGSAGWSGGFFRSNDGGATWISSTQIKPDRVADPTLPREGASVALSAPTNLTLNPLRPAELFISANWRPAFSADGGKTWEERVKGADITVQTDIRFSGDRVYVSAMDEGTFVSEDQGKTWRALWPLKYDRELSGHNWRLAVNRIDGVDRIIATASPWDGAHSVVVIVSEDGGKTFKTTTAGLPAHRITANTLWERGYPRALAVDPRNPKTVYLGIDGDPVDGRPGGGLFKSEDGGYTWNALPNQPGSRRMYYGLVIDPTDSRRLVWGACDGKNGGAYVSDDAGETWSRSLTEDTAVFNVHATATGTLYAGGNNLWRSDDHGRSWRKLTNLAGRSVVGIETDPRSPDTLWISTLTWNGDSNGTVYKSADGGATWEDFTGDLMHRKPQILRFNPATNELWSGQTMLHKIRQ